jgi:hypothetical protein
VKGWKIYHVVYLLPITVQGFYVIAAAAENLNAVALTDKQTEGCEPVCESKLDHS